MPNIFDYLSWRGDLTFEQSPFNPVDNIIFSQLSYFPLEGIVPGPDEKKGISIGEAMPRLAELMNEENEIPRGTVMSTDNSAFIHALESSKRFRNCILRGYVNHVDISLEKQFSALSIITGRKAPVIAFRGTDTNLVAWKESFSISFKDAIPSQLAAVSYLETMGKKLPGKLRLCGHSKGGNLAIYAAAFCKKRIKARISEIYANDAPGFQKKIIENAGFMTIKNRIRSFVPQSSLVGMLLERGNDYIVIKSTETGLMQHSLYSWEVTHNDLVKLEETTKSSRFFDKTLHEWIDGLDNDQRRQFIDGLFTILGASQAKSIHDLTASRFKSISLMIQSLKNIDKTTKTFIKKTLAALFRSARNNLETLRKPHCE